MRWLNYATWIAWKQIRYNSKIHWSSAEIKKMVLCSSPYLHRIGPLGRFGLEVGISVRMHEWRMMYDVPSPCKFSNVLRLPEVVKRKIHKYKYLRIFSLTTSRIRKLILKVDLKRKSPYFYSKFFLKSFGQYLKKKNQKMDFLLYFQKVIWPA